MENVANEAELARGTLYLYFKNKDDIYIAIAVKGSKIFNKMFIEYYERVKPGIEKVKSLIIAFFISYSPILPITDSLLQVGKKRRTGYRKRIWQGLS